MRKEMRERLNKFIPEDAVIERIYPYRADTTVLIIEYTYQGKRFYISPERRSYKECVYYNNFYFYRKEGLTYNDLYVLFSDRFQLDLVEGEDYTSNPTLVGEENFVHLPISPLSLRYLPETITLTFAQEEMSFNDNEETTDLTNEECNPYPANTLLNEMLLLSGKLIALDIDSAIVDGVLTLDCRQQIIDSIDNPSEEFKKELLSATLLSQFNDGVSDVMVCQGTSYTPFIIRYTSK